MWVQQQLQIVVLNEGTIEIKDKQAQRNNITAAEAVAEIWYGLTSLQGSLTDLDDEISNLESRLNDFRAVKQLILHRIHEIGKDNFDLLERRILYSIIIRAGEKSPKSIYNLADMLNEKESRVKNALASVYSKIGNDGAKNLLRFTKEA